MWAFSLRFHMKPIFPRIRMDAKPAGLKFRAPATALAKFDKSIRSAAKAEGEIEIIGEIGESMWSDSFTTAKSVKDQLKAIGKAPVLVTINSPGGDAFEGIAIYNLLREHGGKVTVNVLGLAASAASIIAMAGDTIKMGEAAMMMIHSSHGIVMGNQEDMRQFADLLDSIDSSVASLYASRTGKPDAEVLDMMKKETWFSGEEAVASGFADSYEKKKKKAAASQTTTVHLAGGGGGSQLSAHAVSALLAASGDKARPVVRLSVTPGASGSQSNPKGKAVKTVAEQIASFEAKRAASAERMSAIMATAAEAGATLDETQTQEYDGLASEVKAVDEHLIRLKAHEVTLVSKATTITKVDDPAKGAAVRAGDVITLGPNLKPGQNMGRYAMAMYQAGGNPSAALAIVRSRKDWMDSAPGLEKVLMTAVATGDTTTAGWASELVYAQNLQNEFIEYLRPMTIIGRLTNIRRVPFNVRMGSQTAGSSANWVGQAKPIPVSKLTTSSVSLGITKAAGLVTVDDELMRSSSPSAEVLVRDDLAEAISVFLDVSFIDPNIAGAANVQPPSMLYQVTPITPSGTNLAAISTDVAAVFASAIAANLNPATGVWVMTPTTALKLSLMKTSLGTMQFPDISINGGTWQGLPVIVSQSAKIAGSPQYGEMIVLLLPREILLADDGQVTISISNEASLELKDNPTNSGAGGETATSMVSMFQTHSVAIKAVRYINWTKRRSTAAAFIQAANYA